MSGDEPELEGPKGFRSRFRAYQTAVAQVIPNNANTVVRLDAEDFDTLGELNLALSSFYPRRAGFYALYLGVAFTPSALGTVRRCYIGVNGTNPVNIIVGDDREPPAAGWSTTKVSTIVHMVPGDFAVPVCYQNTGGNLNLEVANTHFVHFAGHRLS